jgi:methyl-accepting chemotaxis protein
MDIKELAENFAEFLAKHSGELRFIGSALQTVVDHLPIDAQDKERLSTGLAGIANAANNISNAAANLTGQATEVVVSSEDVAAAVGEYLDEHPEVIANAGE